MKELLFQVRWRFLTAYLSLDVAGPPLA